MDELEELKRRLVVSRKRGGRCVYDKAAKADLVALCQRPGTSVSRLARECGVNANQVSRWLREHGHESRRMQLARAGTAPTAFVPVPVVPSPAAGAPMSPASGVSLQARMPNGVTLELRSADPRLVGAMIEALGRLGCSDSTRA